MLFVVALTAPSLYPGCRITSCAEVCGLPSNIEVRRRERWRLRMFRFCR
jgi:hypothetical protein